MSKLDVHAKCLAIAEIDGSPAICRKSKGHTESKDPERRRHYDPSREKRWDASPCTLCGESPTVDPAAYPDIPKCPKCGSPLLALFPPD